MSDITGPVNDTVNDLKSTEVRKFPYILRRPFHGEKDARFVFVFLLFSTIDRERRAEDHLLLQFYQKTTPPPPTRARFRAKEKKGEGEEEEEEEEENNGLEEEGFDSI